MGSLEKTPVSCKSCGSDRRRFNGEIAIHFPGLQGLEIPIVWVFPKLFICLNCGAAEFQVPEEQMQMLRKGDAAAAGST